MQAAAIKSDTGNVKYTLQKKVGDIDIIVEIIG
jgi:hypothetical protein